MWEPQRMEVLPTVRPSTSKPLVSGRPRQPPQQPHFMADKHSVGESYIEKVMALMDLDERELFRAMSSEDKYKNSSATFRLRMFRKRQEKLQEAKNQFIEALQAQGKPLPKKKQTKPRLLGGAKPFPLMQRSSHHHVVAGEAMNATQDRLARAENFPLAYRCKTKDHDEHHHQHHHGGLSIYNSNNSASLASSRARQMLMSRHQHQYATERHRAEDMEWRLLLRDAAMQQDQPTYLQVMHAVRTPLGKGALGRGATATTADQTPWRRWTDRE